MKPAFEFSPQRRARRPSLTPLVDVVFLLLVFFMLASRFGADEGLKLAVASGGPGKWQGPPRLIELGPGTPRLNGVPLDPDALVLTLGGLMLEPGSPVVLRSGGADVQALAAMLGRLSAAGYTRLVLLD
jgi:biopolymer transport protein ExbD